MRTTSGIQSEKVKFTLVAILAAAACFFTYYFHVILGAGTVVTHFYYIPVILAALWWKRKGLFVAVFLAAFLVFGHHFLRSGVLTANDYLRATMLVVVGAVVVALSERIEKAQQVLQERSHHLGERVKELKCLYGISNLVEQHGSSLEQILQETVRLIPPSWHYPGITCARLTLPGQEFRTDNFSDTMWKQRSDIIVHREPIGSLEICYLEEKPESDEGPFLREERSLLNVIAERLGRIIEHKQAEEALQKAHEELERRVEERTAELSRTATLLRKEVAERKRAEEELRRINEELKNFVHVVSHDLKTPITYIQGFSSTLLDKHKEGLDDQGRMCLERIDASALRMERSVSDLLALSKVGKVVATFEDVSSLEIVRNVILSLQDRLKESDIELVVADNLPTIYCDGERMYQVFENLLVNAVKFTGGAKNPQIEIGYEDRGDFHQFYVRDNGIGIDPQHHKRIFEMFHRLKVIEDEEGTGLGLAIVDRIVNNHGGKVWVESEKGKGATFHFSLPKAPSPVRLL
jgi:signal transduction histidine kinase